jgi:ElaB/YqjD/DUF883 family membrane-anchored ribosome-binding protein
MTEPTSAATKMVRNISNALSDVKETASVIGRHAVDKIDAIRETVAGTMEESSSVIQEGGKQISDIADVAAQRIQESAIYVREKNLPEMGNDVKDFAKRYPIASVAIGLGVGFLLAWTLCRDA